MPLTATDVRERAAQELNVSALGQALQQQDATRIDQAYAEVWARLDNEGLAVWAFDEDVPDDVAPHVAMLVAHNCLGTYGVSTERFNRIVAAVGVDGDLGRREIRSLVNTEHVDMSRPQDF